MISANSKEVPTCDCNSRENVRQQRLQLLRKFYSLAQTGGLGKATPCWLGLQNAEKSSGSAQRFLIFGCWSNGGLKAAKKLYIECKYAQADAVVVLLLNCSPAY